MGRRHHRYKTNANGIHGASAGASSKTQSTFEQISWSAQSALQTPQTNRSKTTRAKACSKCGGKMKIIAAIEDPKVIRKILDHNGLPTKPPQLPPVRGPPKAQYHFEEDFNESSFEMNFDSLNDFSD